MARNFESNTWRAPHAQLWNLRSRAFQRRAYIGICCRSATWKRSLNLEVAILLSFRNSQTMGVNWIQLLQGRHACRTLNTELSIILLKEVSSAHRVAAVLAWSFEQIYLLALLHRTVVDRCDPGYDESVKQSSHRPKNHFSTHFAQVCHRRVRSVVAVAV